LDPILYWNDVALEADRTTHTTGDPREAGSQGPAGSSRAFAIVHLAMHDAYFGIHPDQEPYLGKRLPLAPASADADAAVASAAHATLSALYPAQKAYFDARHAAAGLIAGKPDLDGHDFGRSVAAAILELRQDDPGLGDNGYSSSPAPGRHRQDPDNPAQGFYAPFYGARSRCFAVRARQLLDPPPRPGTPAYESALRQVRSKGIAPGLAGTLPADLLPSRSSAETIMGLFWSYDGSKGLGTPPRLYNQIVREVAVARKNNVAANARLFALVNAAMGDAGILAWDNKYLHDLWRPVLGIREYTSVVAPTGKGGDTPESEGDVEWLPFGAQSTNSVGAKNKTPNFPAYPSGHATFGAAVFQTVRHFYKQTAPGHDTLTDGLAFVSDELNGSNTDNAGAVRPRVVRRFPRGLWQMIEENGISRVLLGVHWVFDAFAVDGAGNPDLARNTGGVPLGLRIADDIAAHGLTAAAAAGPRQG
jgi:vanadium-dependent haloperoxidase-like protein/PAP2 superfamily protein